MNIEITDRSVFDSFEPELMIRFLESNNWTEVKRVPKEMVIFEKTSSGSDHFERLWIPLSQKFSDFGAMMATAFKQLAIQQGRTQLQMLDDLQTGTVGDVIRVGSEDRLDRSSHTLALHDGIVLHEQARDLARAGAWGALNHQARKPVYPQTMRADVSRFVSNLRLAQSERGSFIVRLISPIGEKTLAQPPLSAEEMPSMPFERRAVMELLTSIRALKDVANDVKRRGKFKFGIFEEAVPNGVNANLCEAVAPITLSDFWRPLEVSVSWCNLIPAPVGRQYEQSVDLSPELIKYIHEASVEFRKRNPESIVLRGAITDLHRASKKGGRAVYE